MRLGLEFGGTNFKLGLMKENGYVMKLELIQAKKLFQSNNIIKEIKNKIDLFLNGKVISCGGISSKGIVDVTKGMVLDDVGEAKILSNIPLREILSSAYDVPFNIDNDARCYALGESKFGGWSKYKNMTCVTLGTGIGCASILNGNLFYGSDNLGGILGGHISINKNGPKCSCGNIGCLELYCSKIGLIRLLKNSKSEHLSKKDPVKSFFTSLNENGSSNNKIFKDFINNFWDEKITPALIDYIKIPNKSPSFDSNWEKNGYMNQALKLAVEWSKKNMPQNVIFLNSTDILNSFNSNIDRWKKYLRPVTS